MVQTHHPDLVPHGPGHCSLGIRRLSTVVRCNNSCHPFCINANVVETTSSIVVVADEIPSRTVCAAHLVSPIAEPTLISAPEHTHPFNCRTISGGKYHLIFCPLGTICETNTTLGHFSHPGLQLYPSRFNMVQDPATDRREVRPVILYLFSRAGPTLASASCRSTRSHPQCASVRASGYTRPHPAEILGQYARYALRNNFGPRPEGDCYLHPNPAIQPAGSGEEMESTPSSRLLHNLCGGDKNRVAEKPRRRVSDASSKRLTIVGGVIPAEAQGAGAPRQVLLGRIVAGVRCWRVAEEAESQSQGEVQGEDLGGCMFADINVHHIGLGPI